jgi:hypothetical protein
MRCKITADYALNSYRFRYASAFCSANTSGPQNVFAALVHTLIGQLHAYIVGKMYEMLFSYFSDWSLDVSDVALRGTLRNSIDQA